MSASTKTTVGGPRLLAALLTAFILFFVVSVPVASADDPEPTNPPETTAAFDTALPDGSPDTTAAPDTTLPPDTTAAPDTTLPPDTTAAPETTGAPDTTAAPETSEAPSTVDRSVSAASEESGDPQDPEKPAGPSLSCDSHATSQSSANAVEQSQTDDATVCNQSRATANSGANASVGAIAGATSGSGGSTGTSSAQATSQGAAAAQGVIQSDQITQTALVIADGTSRVDVLQVALVVNIGFGVANTAGNSANGVANGQSPMNVKNTGSLLSPFGPNVALNAIGHASVNTGNATGVGVVANTKILQAAVVNSKVGDDKKSVENALVVNLGAGTANTGLNKVIGVLSQDPHRYGLGGGATGSATVQSGDVTGIGVASNTLIRQSVEAHATDGALVVITQKGVVLNIGGAIGNTGFNSATGVGGLGLSDAQLAALVQLYGVLNALLEAGGWTLPGDNASGAAAGNAIGSAAVSTGDALAVGVDSATSVVQDVKASAEGGEINSSQEAVVANVGLGVASTGGNVARGVATGGATDDPAADAALDANSVATDALADFLTALSAGSVAPDGTTTVAGLFDFGALIAQLTGRADVIDTLTDQTPGELTGDDPSNPQTEHIRVRQVIGVLSFAFSDANGTQNAQLDGAVQDKNSESDDDFTSWANQYVDVKRALASQTVEGENTASSSSEGTPPDPSTFDPDVLGSAEVNTGDATAGNIDRTSVCQLNNADPAFCEPRIVRFIINPGTRTIITTTRSVVSIVTPPKPPALATPPVQVRGVQVVDPGRVSSGVKGATLPVTGTETDSNLSFAGLLIGAGVFLVLVAALVPRRRATG